MYLLLSSILLYFNFTLFVLEENQNKTPDISVLIGKWELDMSPENKTDSNFANMEITKVDKNSLEGYFYRQGVAIKEGRINTQTGVIHAALISGDNSGEYNTAFYYKDSIIFGTTHSLNRDFLSVWTATRVN